jgi:hypothetical protein
MDFAPYSRKEAGFVMRSVVAHVKASTSADKTLTLHLKR